MRENRKIFIFAFVLFLLSLVISILAYELKASTYIYDLSLAILGGSFLSAITSICIYLEERKRNIEQFSIEARDYAHECYDIPMRLFEIKKEEISKLFLNKYGEDENDCAINKLIKYETKNNKTISKEEAASRVYEYRKYYEDKINYYIRLNEFRFRSFDDCFGEFKFILSKELDGYTKSIYKDIGRIRNKIADITYHLKLYKAGEGRFCICINMINEVDDMIFDYKEEDGCREITPNKLYDIQDKINEMLDSIFHKKTEKVYRNPKDVCYSYVEKNSYIE